ncbi:MAG: major capsid protein P2 [Pseudomonadales bacterium]|nr:major capsid protein P2 [Pseudomonadales bacterium]
MTVANMSLIEQRVPSPEGVAAGQTATFKCQIGRQYLELELMYSGVTLAQMTEIRVMANGKAIHTYSATERDKMNQYMGMAPANGILRIPFIRSKLKTMAAEVETGITTGVPGPDGRQITAFNVEIDIDPAATAPALEMNATQANPSANGPGTIMHIKRFRRNLSGAGEFEISDIPFGGPTTIALNRAFLFEGSGETIDKVKVERNLRSIWERSKALNERLQSDNKLVPQSGMVVIDKTERGYGGDPIQLAGYNDFRYLLTSSGQQNITMLLETMGVLGD